MVAMARRLPHPEPPTARYLTRVRWEPAPAWLARALVGPVPRSVRVRNVVVPEPVELPARTYRPASATGPLPLVINFHGGGFVIGNLASTDWLCGQVAARTGALVVSVSYRLAPEHPAPGPANDAIAATRWLLAHAADWGADPTRAAVMGASAGGNLAALVALAHRDRVRAAGAAGGIAPLRHQILLYPAVDLTLASASVAELADAPLLTRSILDWYGRRYLPADARNAIGPDDPRVSPLFAADHSDLAPALIVAAGQDPLRDDAVRYAVALRAAGVPVELRTYPEAIHGFVSMPRLQPAAKDVVADITAALVDLRG